MPEQHGCCEKLLHDKEGAGVLNRLPGVLLAGGWVIVLAALMGISWVIRKATRATVMYVRRKVNQ